MSTLLEYFSIIGAFQGLLLFILLVTDSRLSSASRILGLICLCLALVLFAPFIMSKPELRGMSWLIGWIFYLPSSLGGLTYLYCRNSILDKPLSWYDLIHITPLLICYLLTADFLLFSQTSFLSWATGAGFISWRLVISEVIIYAQAFFYIGMTALLVRRYQSDAHQNLANFNPTKFKWLWSFILVGLCIWCLKAMLAFLPYVPIAVIYSSDIMIVVLIYFVAMAQWKNPQLFTINQLNEKNIILKEEYVLRQNDTGGALDMDTKANMFNTVKERIEEQGLYRDSELTLSRLAEATGLSTHHLSEVLNQYEGKNFYHFINSYRIAYVCDSLKKQSPDKIIDIAMDAGFASKSTFNSIFKKFVGVTPSQYRQSEKS